MAKPVESERALLQIRTILAAFLVGATLWLFGHYLLLLFAGVLLGVGLNAPAALLSRHTPLKYGWSLLIVVLLLAGGASVIAWSAAPDIADQADQMRARVPELVDLAQQKLEKYQWGRDLVESTSQWDEIASNRRVWTGLAGAFSGAFSATANLVLIFFVGLYVAIQPDIYARGLLFFVPATDRARGRELLERCASVLRYWLFGTMISMAVIGVLTFVGLTILGVPLALILAVIAALLAFIPNIGPVLAAVPAVLLSLLDGPRQAAYVAVLYLGVQAVESYLITPFVQKKTVSLPPALTIAAQFLLGTLAGGFGLFVATPLAALGLTIAREAGRGRGAIVKRHGDQQD